MLPAPPPNCSPTLGVHRTATARERFPMLLGVFMGCAGLALWEHANAHLAWMWAATLFGAAFALIAWSIVRGEISAGSDWVRRVAPLGTAWVRTPDVVEVAVETTLTGSRIALRDAGGRRVHVRLDELAATPEVWRPVRAALALACASGTFRADANARRALGLPAA